MFVRSNMVTEVSPYCFIADMSDVGLTVKELIETFKGFFPTILTTDIGNGENLILTGIERTREGEIGCIVYKQVVGAVQLKLFND